MKFFLDLVPADMKWVAFFSDELNNVATYFSSFANVSIDTMKTVNGKLGEGTDCTWRPWKYKEIENAKKVDVFKKSFHILPSELSAPRS